MNVVIVFTCLGLIQVYIFWDKLTNILIFIELFFVVIILLIEYYYVWLIYCLTIKRRNTYLKSKLRNKKK